MAFGAAMLVAAPVYLTMGWLRVKLLLVLLLIAYHVSCYKLMRDFAAESQCAQRQVVPRLQ